MPRTLDPIYSPQRRALYKWPQPPLRPLAAQPKEKRRTVSDGGLIPVEPVALAVIAAVAELDISWSELAQWLGWSQCGHPDVARIWRRLGIAYYMQRGIRHQSRYIRASTAAQIILAVHLSPVDFDI
jgi:hypothetical protein